MKLFDIVVIPCSPASDFYFKLKKRMMIHTTLETAKLAFIIAIAVFFLIGYVAPVARSSLGFDYPFSMNQILSLKKSGRDSSVKEVLNLASMIRLITDHQISEEKGLRYAGWIFRASQRYEVDPLEIIALIMAESGFREDSINKETGDYGLGQINWEHWGRDYGYTPQKLLDPSINIFLTCHVYKYFGQDFGKYHRGNGIQSKAYLVNVKGILSTLNAFTELKKKKVS